MNWLLHSTIHQVMRYFWVLIVNSFSFLWSIFWKNCVSCVWLYFIRKRERESFIFTQKNLENWNILHFYCFCVTCFIFKYTLSFHNMLYYGSYRTEVINHWSSLVKTIHFMVFIQNMPKRAYSQSWRLLVGPWASCH